MIHPSLSKTTPSFKTFTRIAFWVTIVLIPFHHRIVLQSRFIAAIYTDYTDFLVFASDIALILTLLFWIVYKLLAREGFTRGPTFITTPILALILAAAASVIVSLDPALSLYHTLRLAVLAGIIFYLIDRVHSPDEIAIPVAIQVVCQALVGIGQFLRQSDLGLQVLGEYALDPAWNGISIVSSGGQRWLRAYGLSDHPNILGGSLAFGLLLVLGSYAASDKRSRLYAFPVFALGSLALFLTFSRAAWLAFGAGVVFLAYHSLTQKRRRATMRGLHLIMAALLLLTPFVVSYAGLVVTRLPFSQAGRATPSELQAIGERALLNSASIQVFAKHPILGSGIGTLPQAIMQDHPEFSTDYQPAHFVLIDAAAETGLLGATVYAILLAAPWLAFVFRKDLRTSAAMLTISAALLATLVVGMFDYYTWLLVPGRLWQYLIWGVWAASYRAVTMGAHVG